MRSNVKRREKWRTNSRFLLPGNSPAYWLVLVKDFLVKNDVTTLELILYLPNLAPADFYLFPQLKSTLKGQHFCDDYDIVKNETEELKRPSQDGFQECLEPYTITGRSV